MIADYARLTSPRCIKYTVYDHTRLTPHRCKKHTASFAPSMGKFPSYANLYKDYINSTTLQTTTTTTTCTLLLSGLRFKDPVRIKYNNNQAGSSSCIKLSHTTIVMQVSNILMHSVTLTNRFIYLFHILMHVSTV